MSTWRNEKRRALPSRDNLAKLARFLNLPLEHFDVDAPAPVITPDNVDEVAIDARERVALLDALARETARADRYHEILLREVDAAPTELVVDDVEKRFFSALAEKSRDPSAYALAKRVWQSVIATAAIDRSKERAE